MLARQLFSPERREAALFCPPYGLRFLRGTAPAVERTGRLLFGRLAGVVILEAAKDLFAGVPAGAVAVARRVVMEGAR